MKNSLKSSLKIAVATLVLLTPIVASATTNFTTSTTFCFDGWGTSGVDGTYDYYGEAYGVHEYTNGTFYLNTDGNISNDYAHIRAAHENYLTGQYYTFPATEWIDSAGPWTHTGEAGVDPIGTATLGDCVIVEPPPPVIAYGSTTVATSTLQLVGATTTGFAILITIAFLYLIAYLYNSMFAKKPWHNS